MKMKLSMFCVVLVVGFAATVLAGQAEKVDICHNGSVYIGDTTDGALYDPEGWVLGSFVINISERAVTKHVRNHGDWEFGQFTEGEDVITEVVVGDGGEIMGFETRPSCNEAMEVVDPY